MHFLLGGFFIFTNLQIRRNLKQGNPKLFPWMKLGFILFLLTCPQKGETFTLITGRGWSNSELELHYNWDDCPESLRGTLVDALEEATEVWSSVSTSNLRLKVGNSVNISAQEADAGLAYPVPVVLCNSQFRSNEKDGRHEDATPAYAIVKNSIRSSFISYGAVILNTKEGARAAMMNFSYDKILVIVIHEVGHIIGLGHTDSKKSIMYFSSSYRDKALLSMDDVRGVTYIYPRDEMFFEDSFFGSCGQTLWKPSLRIFPRKTFDVGNILFILLPLLLLLGLIVVHTNGQYGDKKEYL